MNVGLKEFDTRLAIEEMAHLLSSVHVSSQKQLKVVQHEAEDVLGGKSLYVTTKMRAHINFFPSVEHGTISTGITKQDNGGLGDMSFIWPTHSIQHKFTSLVDLLSSTGPVTNAIPLAFRPYRSSCIN